MSTLHVQGVRHHSPACARLVRHAIAELSPRTILIEGPADMNARLGELALAHRLPIAIFSYYQDGERTHASWTPFCEYSPEWVALQDGLARGADVRFIDLPAWAVPFRGVENRYADRPRLHYVERLCETLSIDGLDALWDHLFEQPTAPGELAPRLSAYFDALRVAEGDEGEAHDEGDRARERFMAAHVARAMSETDGPVLLVCGGYHAPYLSEAWRALPPDAPPLPGPAEGARHGSYLVPYSFHRLDRFTGYRSGMPSPAFYQHVWEHGAEAACARVLEAAVARLRKKKQAVSAADLIAVETMARGLMRLRRHEVMARTDLLDAIAAALLKDAQEVPLPWTARGPVRPGTDPMVVEVLIALTGEREGELGEGTPRPPLVDDVEAELERHGIVLERKAKELALDLTQPADLAKSRVLHRLALLGAPGITRTRGAARLDDAALSEAWSLARTHELDARLIEASAYGPTLESAALARLEERLRANAGDLALLAGVLGEALFAGLLALFDRVLAELGRAVHGEPSFDRLGGALALLLGVYRHDTLRGGAGSDALGAIVAAIVRRGLWLFEGIEGPEAAARPEELAALIAIRDAIKHAGAAIGVDAEAARDVMQRRMNDPSAPPAHRGAALG